MRKIICYCHQEILFYRHKIYQTLITFVLQSSYVLQYIITVIYIKKKICEHENITISGDNE